MRPYDSDYDDFDEFDDFEVSGIRAIRHMMNERQRDELRLRGRRRAGPSGKGSWSDNEWGDFNDFDYDADEFDKYSGLTIDNY